MRIARARRDDGADAKDEDGAAKDGEKRSRADGGGLVSGHGDRP